MSEVDSGHSVPASIVIQRRIEWPDTDASGHWHNTAGFRLIEVAETALLDRLGLLDEVYGRLPRVRIDAHFMRLLSFRDVVDAAIEVATVGRSSISYEFTLSRGGEESMRASVVAALLDEQGRPRAWPDSLRTLLMTAGPQPGEFLHAGADSHVATETPVPR